MNFRATLSGILAAIILAIVIQILNAYVLKLLIPDFLAGWVSCTAYFAAYSIHKDWN